MNLEAWLSEPEAARRLGISERQLRTRAAQGKRPERRYRPRPGGKAQPVYNPRDVEDLEATRPVVVPADVPARLADLAAPNVQPVPAWNVNALTPFLERITQALERRLQPPAPVLPWVTMPEAARIIGLSENLLRALVRTGRLGCLRDKQGWKVRRLDLEHLEASKLQRTTADLRQTVNARRAGR